jgi:hypothetical protein
VIKKVLIGIAIFIGVAIFILFIMSTMMPQKMADFFMSLGAVRYDIEVDGEHKEVNFSEMGEGVTNQDRLFLMKKMIAAGIYSEMHREHNYITNEYNEGLIEASEDNLLTRDEYERLREMHSDVLTEPMIEDWIDMAKEYEEIKEHNRRENQQ